MNDQKESFAAFISGASRRRKTGAILCWIAAVALIILLFVPMFEVPGLVRTVESLSGEELSELNGLNFLGLLTNTTNTTNTNDGLLISLGSGFGIGMLVLYMALIVGAVILALFTMIPLSAACVIGAVVQVLLIYFQKLKPCIEAGNGTADFAGAFGSVVLGVDITGITDQAKLSLSVFFIGLLVIAAVLAVASIIARYAMSDDAKEDDDDWEIGGNDTDDGRDRPTGLLDSIALVQLNTGKRFEIPGHKETVIGKSKNADIVISNPAVSRAHAKIFRQDDAFIIMDLNSSNGTYVGDNKLPSGGRVMLKNGDYITLGNEMFEVQLGQNVYGRQ